MMVLGPDIEFQSRGFAGGAEDLFASLTAFGIIDDHL